MRQKIIFIFFAIFIVFLLLSNQTTKAQQPCKSLLFDLEKEVFFYEFDYDTLPILPESFTLQIGAQPVMPTDFRLEWKYTNPQQGLCRVEIILLNEEKKTAKNLTLCFSLLPDLLLQKRAYRSQARYDSLENQLILLDTAQNQFDTPFILEEKREELFSSDLQKSGSLTRGISVGNRQDVFVNSNLNLQLEGNITEDLHLSALISDQDVPFQPEGNTQQLQQFDRILLTLKHKKATLQAGDVILQNQKENYFLRYYKNVQGALLVGNRSKKEENKVYFVPKIGVASAKGQFHSYQLEVQEGVQGAYRLEGANNERFIIIQAASERVFLDGRLLQRGFNYDYVIDYNTAEITFNTNILITRFSRVRVEFEYTNQNYNRTISMVGAEISYKKWHFQTEHYTEKDAARNPIGFELSEKRREILENAGNNPLLAVSESSELIADFSANQILYTQIDTLFEGQIYRIYRRASEGDSPLFRVAFSEVGTNLGDYRLGEPLANGRAYVWVGKNRGNFAPVRLLPLPNQKQMTVFKMQYDLNQNQYFFGELALSKQDKNLLSSLEEAQNQGFAYKIGYQNKGTPLFKQKNKEKNLQKNSIQKDTIQNDTMQKEVWQWKALADLEWNTPNFSFIDRFRSIEYDRNWNTQTDSAARDVIAQVGLGIFQNNDNQIWYQAAYRNRVGDTDGRQQFLKLYKKFPFLIVKNDLFWLQNKKKLSENLTSVSKNQQATWLQIRSEWRLPFRYVQPAYVFEWDKNSLQVGDSVLSTLMNFEQHLFSLQQGDSSRHQFEASYAVRRDFLPQEGEMRPFADSRTLQVGLALGQGRRKREDFSKNHNANFNFTYRNLNYLIDSLATTSEETLMGRLVYSGNWLKNSIKQEFSLAIATGREPAREYTFVEVNVGQGTHTWRDDNADGVQQLDEFYEAFNTDERQYIKLFTPTANYISAYTNDFIYKLNLQTPAHWKDKKNFWLRQLRKFSALMAWQKSRKTTENELFSRLNPFYAGGQNQENLLANRQSLRATLFFYRNNPKYGAELNFLENIQKNLLANGFESRTNQDYELNLRYAPSPYWLLRLIGKRQFLDQSSDFLLNKNYQILQNSLTPFVSFQPSSIFRIALSFRYAQKQNPLGGESARLQEWQAELRLSQATNRLLSAKMRFLRFQFEGNAQSPLGYEMLESLQNGQNITWELNLQQRVAGGLQLTFSYEGRKSPQVSVVHTGRMQISALF